MDCATIVCEDLLLRKIVNSKSSVYCEPFCIKEGYHFEIHHVHYDENEDYSCFMHFHEVHELIVFEKIAGTFFYHQGESALLDNDIVFTPAMETHDFELNEKSKSWFIIQFPAKLLELEELKYEAVFFQAGMHLRMGEQHIPQLQQTIRWLLDSFIDNPHSNKSLALLKLVIVMLAEHAHPLKSIKQQSLTVTSDFKKIQPVVDLFRNQPAVDMSLEEAAEHCHLSPSYFSRLFKRVFRHTFSEYCVRHKLYNAARQLTQSNHSITNISYELNFSSPSHFISLFKKQFGRTPKKYRTDLLERIDNTQ